MKQLQKILIVSGTALAVLVIFLLVYTKIKNTARLLPNALPDYLHEISGITYVGDNRIAAVEDETGSIYIYDWNTKSVVEKIPFGPPGDYEDIAAAKGMYYILRSDGALFEVNGQQTTPYDLNVTAKNNEGLVYDPIGDRLLIATKSKVASGKEFKDKRYVYAFDLATKTLEEEPVLVIDITQIQSYVDNHSIKIEAKNSKKVVKFRPSAIAIHPISHNLYILSAIDAIIIEIDRAGTILHVQQLDKSTFNQPEGITFFANGDMLLANEGGDGKPTLLLLPSSRVDE